MGWPLICLSVETLSWLEASWDYNEPRSPADPGPSSILGPYLGHLGLECPPHSAPPPTTTTTLLPLPGDNWKWTLLSLAH